MLSFFDCECYCGNEFIRVVTVEADSEYSATFEALALCEDIPLLNFVAIAFQLKECPDGGFNKVRFLALLSKTQKIKNKGG